MSAPCEVVFDVVHDYSRRLLWDSMLSEARLLNGATAAAVGVRTLCVGTWATAYLPMETEYISFTRGRAAAVIMTNRPPLFERFAATIKHEPTEPGRSGVTHIYSFESRPTIIQPVIEVMMRREVRGRLRALRGFLAARSQV